tara:strand:+ start:5090 stop:6313 length:1224 start_codon:yes stop_codon:yes gene_type:complete
MANQMAKDLELMFEEYVEGYDAACILSMEAKTSYPDATTMQRAGDTFYKKQNYHVDVVEGLDISGSSSTDLIERFVPTVYRSPDNVKVTLDAKEMRDPEHRKESGKAAAVRLAAQVDLNLYNTVANQASIVVAKTGDMDWSFGAEARALMLSRGIGMGMARKLFMNPFDHLPVAKELGNRAYSAAENLSAYQSAKVPDIAGFKTFETDNTVNLIGIGTVTGTTVSGAQSHTVTAMTNDVPTDNRRMTLTLAGTNIANIKAGDSFTIAGVTAVHQIDKSDTGKPQTFRVISKSGAAHVITPAIIATGPYQNVSAGAGAGAVVTFVNTTTHAVNPFWVQGAVTLDYGKLAFPSGEGANVMTATTKNGVPLIMSYAFDHLKGSATTRFTTLYATTVLDPEQCGIILPNQA